LIVPTLNAAATIEPALASAGFAGEKVVVDGGSRDGTVAIAQAAGARVIPAPRGRGSQLAAGAAAARGEWLLFLHADCRLEPAAESAVAAYVARPDAAARAGYLDLVFDDAAPAARRAERLVRWRCRRLALPYGDQGLLIARPLYEAVGGFAPIPLMEDVDIIRRLGRARLARIGASAISSARRYREGGWLLRPLRNLCCLALYFIGLPPRHIARLYG
jgi:rSAM/selenodomain-associated transferase 2